MATDDDPTVSRGDGVHPKPDADDLPTQGRPGAEDPPADGASPTVPGYDVAGRVGQGGMGDVFEATQHHPRRRVALKLVREGFASDHARRRFEHEAEVLGRLQHPGIAQIYEAGIVNGNPFFAMEFIDGPTLTQYADLHRLTPHERLALFAKVCDAVHHAHTKGVVHRDLKPANILVAHVGDPARPQPKVLDFGIARATDSDILATTMHTDVGQVVGTLPYMSPEQVAGHNDDIDTRSDVYALGVVLYELLAGQLPHDLRRKAVVEAARVIREDAPTRLSDIDTKLRGDIETIVGKAMAKERERRYASAVDLGADIQRFLDDEPIAARPPSTWYQARKFAQRHRALVGGVATTFVVLLAGIVATSVFAVKAEQRRQDTEHARQAEQVQRERAQENADRAKENAAQAALNQALAETRANDTDAIYDYLVEQFSAADPNNPDALTMTIHDVVLGQDIDVISEQFADSPRILTKLLHRVGMLLISIGEPDRAMPFLSRAIELYRADPESDPATLASMLHVYHSGSFGIGAQSEETSRQWEAWLEESIAIRRGLGESQAGAAALASIDLAFLTRFESELGRVPLRENQQYLLVAGTISGLEGGKRSPEEVLDALYLAVLQSESAWSQGREAEARQIVRDTVAVFLEQPFLRRTAGKGLATLAIDLQGQGFPSAAAATMATALEVEREIGGDQSLDYFRVLAFSGRLLVMHHEYARGLEQLDAAYEVIKTRAPSDHAMIDWLQQDLFIAALALGKVEVYSALRLEWEAAGEWRNYYRSGLAVRSVIEGHDAVFEFFRSMPESFDWRIRETGLTPLQYAVLHGRRGYISALVEAGASPNILTREGLTSLHLAMDKGDSVAYDALIAAGADPTIVDASGRVAVRP